MRVDWSRVIHAALPLFVLQAILLAWLAIPPTEAAPAHRSGSHKARIKASKEGGVSHKQASRRKKTGPKNARRTKPYQTAQKQKPALAKRTYRVARPATVTPAQLNTGISYSQFSKQIARGPVRISVLEIDPQTAGIEITPVLASGRMGGKRNVASMVNHHQAIAGINGSFFKPDVGIPLGILMINQELISGPIYDRVALGITKDNRLVMDRVHLAGEVILPSGRSVPLQNVNQPRVHPDQIVLYSARWGARAPKVPANGIQVLIRNSRVERISTSQPLDIPQDAMVISGSYTPEMAELASLQPERPVQVNVYTLPDWSGMKHAIGGGPWLVKEGQPHIDLQAQHFSPKGLGYREPRSAVGITQTGKMLLVAVDGRQTGSVGMTLNELALLMRELGAVQAMNLDGGSSTQMAIHGKVVNVPSSGQIGVSNSLVVKQVNTDNMALQGNQKAF